MKKLALVLTVVMLFTALVGCTPDANGPDNGATGQKDSVNLRSTEPMSTVDPSNDRLVPNMQVLEQVYEGLYQLDESEGGYKLCLAKSVDISDDGLVYTFVLHDDVKFHNGDTMKASDVVFSYERFMANTKFTTYTEMIKSVEAKDDSTVVITLERPYSPILHTFHTVKVMNEAVIKEQGNKFGTEIALAGTGPYYFTHYDPSTKWTLTAFEDYWCGPAEIETINYIYIGDDAAALIAFENGEIDWIEVPLSGWEGIKNSGKWNTEETRANYIQYVAINYDANEVLANDKVREAIAYAMDREAMNLAVFEGYGYVSDFYIDPYYAEAAPTECDVKYEYNPEKAKTLLAEAGYPNGVDVGVILTCKADVYEAAAVVLQSNLADVGITASVSTLDFGVAVDRMNTQDFDICIIDDAGNYDFNNYRQQVHSESVGMYMVKFEGDKFDYKYFDSLFKKGEELTDPEERKTVYTELYNAVMSTYTLLPTIVKPNTYAWVKDLNVVNVACYYRVYQWSWN